MAVRPPSYDDIAHAGDEHRTDNQKDQTNPENKKSNHTSQCY